EVDAKVASAELCRRAKDAASARSLLAALDPSLLDREQRERVAAIRARIALDAGDLTEAAQLLESFPRGTHSLEVRATRKRLEQLRRFGQIPGVERDAGADRRHTFTLFAIEQARIERSQ